MGRGANMPRAFRKSKQIHNGAHTASCGHVLHVGLAGSTEIAVFGFRSRAGRINLGNGAEADVSRSAMQDRCFFLGASEFGGVVLEGALGKLSHAAGAKLEVVEAVAAQAHVQNGCVLFAVSSLLGHQTQFASGLLGKRCVRDEIAAVGFNASRRLCDVGGRGGGRTAGGQACELRRPWPSRTG